MKVKEIITIDDILDTCDINYEGVKEAIIKIAADCCCQKEFYEKFHEYFSEQGLGGDDCWFDCEVYLWLILDGPYSCD